MTFSGYLNVFNFQRVVLAARKADAIDYLGRNLTSFDIYTRFYLSTLPSQTRSYLYFLQPPYLQRHADAVAGKGAPLYNCFDIVGGTMARTRRPVLNERVVYSHDARVNGVKFQTVVSLVGLIINLEGLWEGRRHDCVLCFMNRVY